MPAPERPCARATPQQRGLLPFETVARGPHPGMREGDGRFTPSAPKKRRAAVVFREYRPRPLVCATLLTANDPSLGCAAPEPVGKSVLV